MSHQKKTDIAKVLGRQILDSRGNPTVEVEVTLASGIRSRAGVPSGASTGSREALELRDGDKNRYGGKGVLKAVENVNGIINDALMGFMQTGRWTLMRSCWNWMEPPTRPDWVPMPPWAFSLAVAKAAAMAAGLPLYKYLGGPGAVRLPVPMLNIINGGAHARWQGSDFQEYMIGPYGGGSFREAMQWASEIYQALRSVLMESGHHVGVGDEGGFSPMCLQTKNPWRSSSRGLRRQGSSPGADVGIALDPPPASSTRTADTTCAPRTAPAPRKRWWTITKS